MTGMKMAKASRADIDMALTLSSFLEAIDRGHVPDAVSEDAEAIEFLDDEDGEQCGRIVRGLRDILRQGSLFRVVYGMAVVCDPRNKVIDPDADTLEVHPDLVLAAEQRDQLQESVKRLERHTAVLKEANRLIGERLVAGRPLVDAPAKHPEARS